VKSRGQSKDFAKTAVLPERTREAHRAGETQELRSLSVQEIEEWLKADPSAEATDAAAAHLATAEEHDTGETEHSVYDEYVRGFDDVPTLLDAVGPPPPRRHAPDFRQGERPDLRREPRVDARALRETKAADLERAYVEYLRPDEPARPASKKPAKHNKSRRSGKRKKR
jgi:hypothetical protein